LTEYKQAILYTPASNETVKIKLQSLGTPSSGGSVLDNIVFSKVTGNFAINNGSNANCGIRAISAHKTYFTCTDKGANPVTMMVTANNGLTSSCSSTVTVVDNQKPTITTLSAISVNADAGVCTYASSQLTKPTAADNCSVISVVASPASLALGANTVTWTATDGSGLTETSTQVVTVVDNQKPTIATLSAISVNANPGVCTYASSQLTKPIAADNCSVISVVASPASLTSGANTVTWTATDGSGLTQTSTQMVTVVDNQNPTITCPSNQTIASCSELIPDYRTSAIVSDNCGAGGITITQNPIAGTSIASGATVNVTLTVKDASNNSAS
jgi:hypothetical protein